ncbi:Hsp70 family protein [Nocardia sp. NPDC127579]|uniref:Hsp70 family protein n=1 Tax=Nocardia sp. NPDC127579 TaxID=3345402 RepID=UPI0036391B80
MAVFGIDLGTTYSCIAYMDDVGRPAIVRLSEGRDILPSVVYFESAEDITVGAAAKESALIQPDLVVGLIKREMGNEYKTPEIHGRRYSPEEVSAYILRKLAAEAEQFSGHEVRDVVITVPAYFGAAERESTRRAGEIAGLNVIDIVSEPVAAAVDYGVVSGGTDADILVYDLGGGTFDTTVISIRGGDIQVVCTDGDHDLGGADWDRRLVEYFAEEFRAGQPDASDPLESSEVEQDLLKLAEEAKQMLSSKKELTRKILHDGRRVDVTLTRQGFEDLTRDLLDRTIDITKRTVEEAARRGVSSFDKVLLVGGSTRMPAVLTRLTEQFGFDVKVHDPDLAVAKGATRYAFEESFRHAVISGDTEKAKQLAAEAGLSAADEQVIAQRQIQTVASRSFGMEATDKTTRIKRVHHLIHGNDVLPTEATQPFYTLEDGQTRIRVRVHEQAGARESDKLENNACIGEGDVAIPPGKLAGWPIDVTFGLAKNGTLDVVAIERETGARLDLTIDVGGMTEDEVEQARQSVSAAAVS